jgi:hypothetical protein
MGNCCKPNFISSLLGNNVNGALRSTIAQIEALQKCCAKNGEKIDANSVLVNKLYNTITPYGTTIDEINTKADTILDKIQNIKITYTGGGDTPMDLTNYLTKDITWKFATNYDTSKTTFTLEDLMLDTINSISSDNSIVTKKCLTNYVASEIPFFNVLVAYTSGNTPYYSLSYNLKNFPTLTGTTGLGANAGPIVTEQAMVKYFEKSRDNLTFQIYGGSKTNCGNEFSVTYAKLQKVEGNSNAYALATQDYVDSYYQKKIDENCRIASIGPSDSWFSDKYYNYYSLSDLFGDRYKDSRDNDLIDRKYLNKYVEAKALDKSGLCWLALGYDSTKGTSDTQAKTFETLVVATSPTNTTTLTTQKYVDDKVDAVTTLLEKSINNVEVIESSLFKHDNYSETEDENVTKTTYSLTWDYNLENFRMLNIKIIPGYTLVLAGCGSSNDIQHLTFSTEYTLAKTAGFRDTTFKLVVPSNFLLSANVSKDDDILNSINGVPNNMFYNLGNDSAYIAPGTYIFDFNTQCFKKEINEDYLNDNYILNDTTVSIETTDGTSEQALSAIGDWTLITSDAVDAKIENAGPVNIATFSNDIIELEDLTANDSGGFDLDCVPGKTYIFDGDALYESLGSNAEFPIVVKPMSESYTKAGIKATLVFIYNEKIQFNLTGVGPYASTLSGTVTSNTIVELNGISSTAALVSGTIEN